jgi:hypothetical protein
VSTKLYAYTPEGVPIVLLCEDCKEDRDIHLDVTLDWMPHTSIDKCTMCGASTEDRDEKEK